MIAQRSFPIDAFFGRAIRKWPRGYSFKVRPHAFAGPIYIVWRTPAGRWHLPGSHFYQAPATLTNAKKLMNLLLKSVADAVFADGVTTPISANTRAGPPGLSELNATRMKKVLARVGLGINGTKTQNVAFDSC